MTTIPIQFVDESPVNGTQGPFVVESPAMKRSSAEAGLDSDSDSDGEEIRVGQGPGGNPKPGKKTKGRVKIKMEFIENKLRRYTTFSKRKTGIMKKAYELSTLTGTQVMLLVASETGHVYTFATRKLQPMITSESGKALIQTCLNSPDNGATGGPPTLGAGGGGSNPDERMNPTGFEEPELSYGISEDEQAKASDSPTMAQLYSNPLESSPSPTPHMGGAGPSTSSSLGIGGLGGLDMKRSHSPTAPPPAHSNNNGMNSFLGTGSASSTPSPNSNKGATLSGSPGQTQAYYRLPTTGAQIVNLPVTPAHMAPQNNNEKDSSSNTNQTSAASGNGSTTQAPPGGAFMYQTPQGVVYATPSSGAVPGLPEGYILNLPQTSALQGMTDQPAGGAQQFITIPVSLAAGGAQVLQPMIAQPAAASPNPSMVQQLSSKSK